MKYEAVIFDLDGVILSTDELHYGAWKRMSDREGIPFDRETNERLRGITRMDSLAIILERSEKVYPCEEKVKVATFKNDCYRESLSALGPEHIFPGVQDLLDFLKARGIKIAIGSSSKNAKLILERIELDEIFEAISDGTNIERGKPDPEVFIKAADMLGVVPEKCLVVEDAAVGIDAALAANMDALGVCSARDYGKNTYSARDVESVDRSIF